MITRAALLGLLMMTAAPAVSAPLTVSDVLGSFNAVTQSFSGNSEAEGRVIIDGDVTGSVIVNDRNAGANGDGYDDLIITGNATNATVKVGNSGNLTIGGNLTNSTLEMNGGVQTVTLGGTRSGGNFNKNEDVLIENAPSLNIPEIDFDVFRAESQRLAALSGPTTISTNASGQRIFGGAPLLNLDFSFLTSGTGVFDLTGLSDGLIINVAGTGGAFGLNFVDFLGISKLVAAESVVWNFFEATGTVNLNAAVHGHILAPDATVVLGSSNEGSVIAKSILAHNGELHPLTYAGNLPDPSVSAVPLPAGMWLMVSGLAGLAGFRRFRRNA